MTDKVIHKPPKGTLFRHYKRGGLYRQICVAGAALPGLANRQASKWLFDVVVATNSNADGYEVVGLYHGPAGLWTPLPYSTVIYVAQDTLCIYARRETEFYGLVIDGEGRKVLRFQQVNP